MCGELVSGWSIWCGETAATSMDDFSGGFVGGEEERLFSLELEDEAVEDVGEIFVGTVGFAGDGGTPGAAVIGVGSGSTSDDEGAMDD